MPGEQIAPERLQTWRVPCAFMVLVEQQDVFGQFDLRICIALLGHLMPDADGSANERLRRKRIRRVFSKGADVEIDIDEPFQALVVRQCARAPVDRRAWRANEIRRNERFRAAR